MTQSALPPPKLPRIVAIQSGPLSYLLFADGHRVLPGGIVNGYRLTAIGDTELLFEDANGVQHSVTRWVSRASHSVSWRSGSRVRTPVMRSGSASKCSPRLRSACAAGHRPISPLCSIGIFRPRYLRSKPHPRYRTTSCWRIQIRRPILFRPAPIKYVIAPHGSQHYERLTR